MRKSRFSAAQIIAFIKRVGAGIAFAELRRQHGVSPTAWLAAKTAQASMANFPIPNDRFWPVSDVGRQMVVVDPSLRWRASATNPKRT